MNAQFIGLLIFLFALLVLIVLAEILHRYAKFSTESSRKFLHVSGGLMCLLFPRFFQSHWWVLALTGLSFVLLLFTYQKKMLPSIHRTKRNSVGSVLFPIPVYLCFLLADRQNNWLIYYLPISLLTISDTAAEIGGHQWGHLGKKFFGGQKTLAGSLSFFITAIIVVFCWMSFGYHLPLTYTFTRGLLIAVAATIAEGVTLHGWDNLSVPAVVALILMAP